MIQVGMTLPWTIYGSGGQILLNENQQIPSQKILDIVFQNEAYRMMTQEEKDNEVDAENNPSSLKLSPLQEFIELKAQNNRLLNDIYNGDKIDKLADYTTLAKKLIHLCEIDSHILRGSLILDRTSPYTHIHPLMVAIASIMMGWRIKLEENDLLMLTIAALTANVGMLNLMDDLAEQTIDPTPEQRKGIVFHPSKSCQLLCDAGIDDPVIQSTIINHHEKLDGSGYPNRIKGKKIPKMSCILSLADIYSAMVLPRQYRDGLHAKKAIQFIFQQRTRSFSNELAEMFIKEMGIYPPGIFVSLKNDEKGIVIQSGFMESTRPVVSVIYDTYGELLPRPLLRNSMTLNIYGILETIPTESIPNFTLDEIWQAQL